MSLVKFLTWTHTALSLVTIFAGFIVVKGLIQSQGRQLWTFGFLWTAALTTLTGFFFPFQSATPAFTLGVISIVPILLAFLGRYRYRLAGGWRGTYVASAVLTLYFNCFVLIVQIFQKVPAANLLAPTQSEPPFIIAQLATLVVFIASGVIALFKFRPLPIIGSVPLAD